MTQHAQIDHEAISASAGSGKTFQLAHRYIRLLALGVPPERVCALTFSRKAAGEIFESIADNLCAAAATAAAARKTGGRIGIPGATRRTFQECLRRFLDGLHRCQIGTLDSFIVGVLRAFPAELGIAADFEVMDGEGAAAGEVRREALDRLFRFGGLEPRDQAEFLAAFKQATFGREEKSIGRLLERFVEEYRRYLQAAPGEALWGRAEAIWPDGSPWLGADGDVRAASAALRAAVSREGESAVAERWRRFADALETYTAGGALPSGEATLMERLLDAMDDLRAGKAEIVVYRRASRPSPEVCRAAAAAAAAYMAAELRAALASSAGLWRVLTHYENAYQAVSRRTGRLSFEDAQYVLARGHDADPGLVLSREPGGEGRLYIDYRMDHRLDHWLLDEFQDTSDLQWATLSNLLDEVLQDTSGTRSFFYVGDVKQAIYAWRGGNPRLFDMVRERYGPAIRVLPLHTSYRSCPEIIDTVNRVFGDLGDSGLPAGTVERWAHLWSDHESAGRHVPHDGHVALIEPPCAGGEVKPTNEDAFALAARVINRIEPETRGLSVAVLVRSNEAGRAALDVLRRLCPGRPSVLEGHATIVDNPAVNVLLSLMRCAAHPGDTLAWKHVLMSPLTRVLNGPLGTRTGLVPAVLGDIQARGFTPFVETWTAHLEACGAVDAFARMRLRDLREAAADVDAAGSRDIDAFLRHVADCSVREEAGAGAIRVMTMHQAKGLGFDVVLLPDLMTRGMDAGGRADMMLKRDAVDGPPAWVLRMPRRMVAERDPVLADAMRQSDEDDAFEQLCLLYVALTRAKRALYMITCFPGRTSTALTPAALIKQRLHGSPNPVEGEPYGLGGEDATCLYEAGGREWYVRVPAAPRAAIEAPPGIPPDFARRASTRRRLGRILPSASDPRESLAGRVFSTEMHNVLDFGSAIHALFERVEWIEGADAEAILAAGLPALAAEEIVKRDAAEQFRQALRAPEVRRALARPAHPAALWRERRFDIVLDGNLVTGVFDRVVVARDASGAAAGAEIIDYKSNRVDDDAAIDAAAEGYHGQLGLYRRALARILRLAEERIACRLIFTRPGRVLDL